MPLRFLLCTVLVLASGANAFAQGAYVSASLFGDIVRATHTESSLAGGSPAAGEALGFALRAGVPVGDIWGVEVEFARPGEIENEAEPRVLPLAQQTLTFTSISDLPSVSPLLPTILPLSLRSAQRHSTLSASAWVQQQLSSRVAMVYLAGMGFYRSEQELEYTFPRLAGAIPPGLISIPSYSSETIHYGVRPMAGLESRLEMTDHAHLAAGIRLHASSGIWLVRPSVGLGWTF
jgi:hypothetical protein